MPFENLVREGRVWVPSFLGKWMLNPQEGGRLKRHYVILAKALDGIWPVGDASAVLCCGKAAAGASAQHCTGMTNWPNTIHCLGQDDIMSLGIQSSASMLHVAAKKGPHISGSP